jgi:glycosyltransferase involved in cell wall biosynthesis
MRIGFFTDTYLPVIHGVEISIETFRKSLEKMGHKVFIYAPHAPGYKDKNPNVFRFQSIKVIKKPEMRLAFPFWPKNHIGEITDFKLDIAHSHTPFSMGLLAKYITDYQKIPLVYTHHTHYPEYAKFYLKERVITPFLARFFSGWYANLADAIIAPSYKMKKFLREYGVKKNRPIYILPTGINLQIFRESKEVGLNFRKKLYISPEAKILLFVGRMGKEKNPEFLLKALKETLNKKGDIILLMIGDGPFLKELQKMARRMKIEEKVIFRGAVPYKEIPFYYQASDIFVFSSLTDTQGIVILEALACGLPVVALKDDAFEEMVIDNENGFLVKKFLPEIFAERVLKILDDSVIYQSFSDNSRKIAHNFSEENQAKKLLNIYKSLI